MIVMSPVMTGRHDLHVVDESTKMEAKRRRRRVLLSPHQTDWFIYIYSTGIFDNIYRRESVRGENQGHTKRDVGAFTWCFCVSIHSATHPTNGWGRPMAEATQSPPSTFFFLLLLSSVQFNEPRFKRMASVCVLLLSRRTRHSFSFFFFFFVFHSLLVR
jgi:hypothetical protein